MTSTTQPTATTTGVSEAMVDAALNAWFEQPDREDDMSLERSIRAALEAALSTAPSGDGVPDMVPTHRHVKRGSEYEIVGKAEVQCSSGDGLTEAEMVIVYRGKSGDLWVRRVSEFEDGRFVALSQNSGVPE